jgi:hypothetical protein
MGKVLTWKIILGVLMGAFVIFGVAYILEIGLIYVTNNQKIPNIKVGVCITSSLDEFPKCSNVYKISKIGKYNVLLETRDGKYLLNEVPIRLIKRFYGEVECDCSDEVKWK